jgi:hypothetical protein
MEISVSVGSPVRGLTGPVYVGSGDGDGEGDGDGVGSSEGATDGETIDGDGEFSARTCSSPSFPLTRVKKAITRTMTTASTDSTIFKISLPLISVKRC